MFFLLYSFLVSYDNQKQNQEHENKGNLNRINVNLEYFNSFGDNLKKFTFAH